MTKIITFKKGYKGRSKFAKGLRQHKCGCKVPKGLTRHLIVDDVPDEMKDDPNILAIEDDLPVFPAGAVEHQDLDFPTSADLSWPIARIIRRNKPWPNRIKFPFSTFYKASRNGEGVSVYFIDSGTRASHSEFGGRATNVADYTAEGNPNDTYHHGTSTGSAAIGNTVGTARGASLYSFKVFDSSGGSTQTIIINALGGALSHYNAREFPAVLNMSLTTGHTTALSEAITDLVDAGVVILAAAGNDMNDVSTNFPAAYDNVIAVGGISMVDEPYYAMTFGTAHGFGVDICAPSQRVRLANFAGDDEHWLRDGTSLAVAFTTGVVACMLEGHSKLTSAEDVTFVKNKLLENAATGIINPPNYNGILLPDRILYLDPTIAAPESFQSSEDGDSENEFSATRIGNRVTSVGGTLGSFSFTSFSLPPGGGLLVALITTGGFNQHTISNILFNDSFPDAFYTSGANRFSTAISTKVIDSETESVVVRVSLSAALGLSTSASCELWLLTGYDTKKILANRRAVAIADAGQSTSQSVSFIVPEGGIGLYTFFLGGGSSISWVNATQSYSSTLTVTPVSSHRLSAARYIPAEGQGDVSHQTSVTFPGVGYSRRLRGAAWGPYIP